MKRTMTMVFGVAAIFSALTTAAIMAEEISHDVNYKGTVNFDEGAIVKIKNVQVTATAAQLNSAGGGSTTTLTPTLVSNATLKVYGRDLEITNSITIKAGSLDSAGLTGNILVARLTNALPSSGSYIGGNVPVAAITNAAGSLGASIGGNIPVAAITNAAKTVGASIGGNIPLAAMTNALSPTLYSGTVTNDLATTNVFVILNGVVVSVTRL